MTVFLWIVEGRVLVLPFSAQKVEDLRASKFDTGI